jgi:phenylacetate-CoA ligase
MEFKSALIVMNKELSIIAPVYNEEDLIYNFIEEVENTFSKVSILYEIILVNDGSTDSSGKIIDQIASKNKNIIHVRNKDNLGIWKSWHEGVKKARYDSICIIDSDLQYQPEEILNLYEKHIEGYQFVQGVRKYSAEVESLRNFISKILSIFLKIFFYKHLKNMNDVKSGFFVTRKDLIVNIFECFPSYNYGQTFIAIYANIFNSFVYQLPVVFAPRREGKSYLRIFPLITITKILFEIVNLKFFLRKRDYHLIILEKFVSDIRNPLRLSFLEKFKMKLFFKTYFFHKWTIGKNLEIYLDYHLKFQKLSKELIKQYQIIKLKDLVWYFYQNSEFFRNKLLSKNIHPYDIKNIEDLEIIPYLDKKELKSNFSKNLLSKKIEYYKKLFISTSGSTGNPINLYANAEQLKARWANTFRAWTWTGWSPSKKQARLWHQTIGMSKSQILREYIDNLFFKRIFIPAYSINSSNINKLIEKLIKHKPFMMDGYAESFNFLINYLKSKNINNFKLDVIISSAQEMPINLKREIEDHTSAKVYDKYGAREFSGIAYEAKNNIGHLIADDSYIVEVLKNGTKVQPGEIGEIYITDLNNMITPMIRYQIGDLATIQKASSSKDNLIPFNTLDEIKGRTRTIVLCGNNTWVPGTFFAHFFKEYSSTVKQYQIVQNQKSNFELKLIKHESTSQKQIDKMILDLRNTVGEIEIKIEYVDEIQMVKTGKVMGVISNLDLENILNN